MFDSKNSRMFTSLFSSFTWITSIFFIAQLCMAEAPVNLPRLALYDEQTRRILSVTSWREIDFGSRSAISKLQQPARVYALQATIPVVGVNPKSETRAMQDFSLIPFCVKSDGDYHDLCSLQHFEGYVMFRYRNGWEVDFSISMWRDATLNANMKAVVHSFREVVNDSSIQFPFAFDEISSSGAMGGDIVRRYDAGGRCSDINDECFQERYMTYTKSFKELPPTPYSGRILLHIGQQNSWNGPWTLRMENTMPFDSVTNIDAIVVLMDTRQSFHCSKWLTRNPLGNLFLMLANLALVLGFIVGVKELGMQLSKHAPIGERRRTVLYENNENETTPFSFLHRVMLAVKESLAAVAMQIMRLWEWIHYKLMQWNQQRQGRVHLDIVVEAAAPREEIYSTSEVEVREMTVMTSDGDSQKNISKNNTSSQNNNDNNTDNVKKNININNNDENKESNSDEDDEEYQCRICRCTKPVEDLFAPCSCNGSAKYVHHSCLEQWRKMTSNEEHRRVCAECKTPYVLILERVPVPPDRFLGSQFCVPFGQALVKHTVAVLFLLFQLWLGGYYLKFGMYLATGFDAGVIWSATHFYHWLLGFYYIVALGLNLYAFEYILQDFLEVWQQLILLLFSLCAVEIPLGYVGQVIVSWWLNRTVTLEVSYGSGIIMTFFLYFEVLPHLYEYLQSLSTVREVVAPRRERESNTEAV